MGYRSSLHALVHGSDLLAFLTVIKDQDLDNEFTRIDEEVDEEGYSRYEAYDLKWYDDYSCVQAVNAIFRASDYSCLLRVGEEQYDEEYITHNSELSEKYTVYREPRVEF